MSALPVLHAMADAPPAHWAAATFGTAVLGDARRTQRLVEVAAAWAALPKGSLPNQAEAPAALKATYRLLHNDEIAVAALLAPHQDASRRLASQQAVALLVQDTTFFDFTAHRATTGLAPIGDGRGRGFHLQTVLGVTPERVPIGVLAAEFWLRHPIPTGETRTDRAQRPRESEIWGRMVERIGPPPAGVRWVHVADRGADVYAFFAAVQATGSAVVVRLVQNRRVTDDDGTAGHLLDHLRAQPAQGTRPLEVTARPRRPARTATLAVSWIRTTLQPPHIRDRRQSAAEPCSIWAIRVWEPDPPDGVEPLEWLLATTVPVATIDEAWERVDWYTTRWVIEEFHQCLKSGCGAEATQLRDRDALWRRIALLIPLAVRLLLLRSVARQDPDLPVALVADPVTVALVAKRTQLPPAATAETFLRQVARLGGHQGRTRDGPPGWKTLWRGWEKVETLREGVRFAHELKLP
jgi:hypothetical protein